MNSFVAPGAEIGDPHSEGKSDSNRSLVIVFLDFDGVLHPYSPWPHDESIRAKYFSCLPRFEAVLRDCPHVRVVIASDWRRHHSLERLRSFFSADIRERIIGTTALDPSTSDAIGHRQSLAEQFLRDHDLVDTHWIAVDDIVTNYRPDAPLVVCKDLFGAQEEAALRRLLREGP